MEKLNLLETSLFASFNLMHDEVIRIINSYKKQRSPIARFIQSIRTLDSTGYGHLINKKEAALVTQKMLDESKMMESATSAGMRYAGSYDFEELGSELRKVKIKNEMTIKSLLFMFSGRSPEQFMNWLLGSAGLIEFEGFKLEMSPDNYRLLGSYLGHRTRLLMYLMAIRFENESFVTVDSLTESLQRAQQLERELGFVDPRLQPLVEELSDIQLEG